jgi:hypothetical protein
VPVPVKLPWNGNQPGILDGVHLFQVKQLDPHLLVTRYKAEVSVGIPQVLYIEIIKNHLNICVSEGLSVQFGFLNRKIRLSGI